MFGFSLAELLICLIVALFFIRPKDLPQIARFLGKTIFKAKKIINDLKKQFKEMEEELGIEDLKQELNQGIAQAKIEDENEEDNSTTIIDIYGQEHKIKNIQEIRPDLTIEEIKAEIKKSSFKD